MTEFEESYKKYKEDMYRAARKVGASHNMAKDCVQEASEKLSQMSTIQYLNPHKVRGLFCGVTRNLTINALIKNNRYNKNVEAYASVTPLIINKREKEMLISVVVHRALARMSELDSYIAWKYYAQEQSLQEMVEDLKTDKNIDWSTVKLWRYLKKTVKPILRKELISLGGDKM